MSTTTFPERLAQARRLLAVARWEDVNDSKLAELLGTTTASMSRWMAGQMPTRDWLAKMEQLLPVTAQYLEYGGDDLGEPPVRDEQVVAARESELRKPAAKRPSHGRKRVETPPTRKKA